MSAREHLQYQAMTYSKGTFEVVLPVVFVTVSLWTGCPDAFESRAEFATGGNSEFLGQQFGLVEATPEQPV